LRRLPAVILTALILLGLYIIGCSGSKKNPMNPGGAADVTINITGQNGSFSYSPSPDTVDAGTTVSWHNSDTIGHTATSTSTNAFGTGTLAPNATSPKVALNTPGTIHYQCTIHPAMVGTIVVR
jgi:plastocyanin